MLVSKIFHTFIRLYRFLHFCKKIGFTPNLLDGNSDEKKYKLGANQVRIFAPWITPSRCEYSILPSLLLICSLSTFFQFLSYLSAPRVNLRTWQVLCFVVYILGIELKISWLFYLFKNELQSYGFWKFQIVSWCTFYFLCSIEILLVNILFKLFLVGFFLPFCKITDKILRSFLEYRKICLIAVSPYHSKFYLWQRHLHKKANKTCLIKNKNKTSNRKQNWRDWLLLFGSR